MPCTVDLISLVDDPNAILGLAPLASLTPCPECDDQGPINNPGVLNIVNNEVNTDNIAAGCYTVAIRTEHFDEDCEGCGDCAHYRFVVIPSIEGGENQTFELGCINEDCVLSYPDRIDLLSLVNCGEPDNCSGHSPLYRWRKGPADTEGITVGANWTNSWTVGTNTLTSNYTKAFPGYTDCNGVTISQQYRIVITIGGLVANANTYINVGRYFMLCEYVNAHKNDPGFTGQFTVSVNVFPVGIGCNGGAGNCNGASSYTFNFTYPETLPDFEQGKDFCNA